MVPAMDAATEPYLPASGGITVLMTSWCGYCRRLRYQLKRDGIPFTEVDIEADPQAADVVTTLNHGNRTVPTVVFADGSAATNPSIREVSDRIAR